MSDAIEMTITMTPQCSKCGSYNLIEPDGTNDSVITCETCGTTAIWGQIYASHLDLRANPPLKHAAHSMH
jgi:DNA-directed RNA polymerase subunit RPC12/RpoP